MHTTLHDRLVSAALLVLWITLVASAWMLLPAVQLEPAWASAAATGALALVIGTVWLNGLRSLVVLSLYPFFERRKRSNPVQEHRANVALLYCTADDFNARALTASMRQTHDRITTYILDDSREPRIQADIDDFASRAGVVVVRREHRSGFKAGNLNHFLARHDEHDYVVVVDSDEVLPPHFVQQALDHVAASSKPVGVVQGRHSTLERASGFADEFGAFFETHIQVTQLVRSSIGFSFFMGRGALISTECLRATGGFPEVVAEDLAFSIEATQRGYAILYAPELVSTEEYPIDYAAFRKQYDKFTQGSVEILKRYLVAVLRSPLRPAQKADVLLEIIAAPLGAALSALLLVISGVAIASSAPAALPAGVGLSVGLCGLLPFIPETVRRLRRREYRGAAVFVARATALYASMLWTTIVAGLRVAVGRKARFLITPKTRSGSRWASCRGDVVGAVAVAIASTVAFGSILPAMGFVAAAACAVYFSVASGGWAIAAATPAPLSRASRAPAVMA
ncbi:MAG: glycosyltransferase [Rhodoglobus sp.]